MRIIDKAKNFLHSASFDPTTPAVQAKQSAVDRDGYFSTGDVASIDPLGFVRITDRVKDVIKSGGEWISSIEVENAALSHEQVRFSGPSAAATSSRPLSSVCHSLL